MNNYEAFAAALVAAFLRYRNAERPVDKKTARAEFDGMCKAADALDLPNAMTPTAVFMAVMDAAREAGDVPQFSASGAGIPQFRAWSATVAATVRATLGWV